LRHYIHRDSDRQDGPQNYVGRASHHILNAATDSPRLSARDVLNAADYSGGRVAPGEIVVLFPSNAGPEILAGAQLDAAGWVTTSLGETRVLFDGIAAPMVSAYSKIADYPVPRQAVRVKVGGEPAEIIYAGAAPHAVEGLLQVNFRVPAKAPLSDAVPVTPRWATRAVRMA